MIRSLIEISREQAKWIALRALKFPESGASYAVALREGKLSDVGPGYSVFTRPAKRLDRCRWIGRVVVHREEDFGILMCPTPITDVWIDKCTGDVLRIEGGYDNDNLLMPSPE